MPGLLVEAPEVDVAPITTAFVGPTPARRGVGTEPGAVLCVITGATSGLGRASALALGARGADLVLVGRNRTAGEAVAARIRRWPQAGNVTFLQADLSSRKEVIALAGQIARSHPVVDVLINNAGARFDHFGLSPDGLERTFATNHVGHFLLTALLLEELLRAPSARVITVASNAHLMVGGEGDWCLGPSNYDRRIAYPKSKLANIMFAYELSRRLKGTRVASNAVDPGIVLSHFARNNGWLAWIKHMGSYALKGQLCSARRSAETIVLLALSPELKGVTDKYFYEKRETESSAVSRDATLGRQLWSQSVHWSGLDEQMGSAWKYIKP
jgi:retinol dehydrogenase 14